MTGPPGPRDPCPLTRPQGAAWSGVAVGVARGGEARVAGCCVTSRGRWAGCRTGGTRRRATRAHRHSPAHGPRGPGRPRVEQCGRDSCTAGHDVVEHDGLERCQIDGLRWSRPVASLGYDLHQQLQPLNRLGEHLQASSKMERRVEEHPHQALGGDRDSDVGNEPDGHCGIGIEGVLEHRFDQSVVDLRFDADVAVRPHPAGGEMPQVVHTAGGTELAQKATIAVFHKVTWARTRRVLHDVPEERTCAGSGASRPPVGRTPAAGDVSPSGHPTTRVPTPPIPITHQIPPSSGASRPL